jgi:transcriptional regulator with PAS, ATPase and Fis domain
MDFPALLDGLPVGVVVLDRDRRVLFLNKALEALTGVGRAEASGAPCAQILRSTACLRRCPHLPGASQTPIEGDCLSRDRRKAPIRVTPVLVRDREGELLFRLDVVEELTVREAGQETSPIGSLDSLVARSAEMRRILDLVPVLAQSEAPLLITGETGTGKDLLAEALHRASPRSRQPFVRLSLSPMPEALLESELFGHVKGAAPWAEEDKPGRFQAAGAGTLCLSEIADLPLPQQAKLVRFLDEKVVLPVGGDKPVRAGARLIAITGSQPEALLAAGRLREDLFHRLSALRIHLPPLRERAEDVDFLLTHFLRAFARKLKKKVSAFSEEARRALAAYPFPGNVRELKNIVDYAVMVCPGETIGPEHLPAHLSLSAHGHPGKGRAAQGRKAGRRS